MVKEQCDQLSYFSSTCESEQMLKRRTPNVKTKGRTSMDKCQRRSPQTRSPQCGCSHGSAGDFDTRRKKKNDRVQAQGERRRTIGFKRAGCAISEV